MNKKIEKKPEQESNKGPGRARSFIRKLLLGTSLVSSTACSTDEIKNKELNSTSGVEEGSTSTGDEATSESNHSETKTSTGDQSSTSSSEDEITGNTEDETTGELDTDDESTTGSIEGETSTGEELNEAPEFDGPILASIGEGELQEIDNNTVTTNSNLPVTFEVPVLDIDNDDVTVNVSFIGDNLGCTIDTPEQIISGEGNAVFTLTPELFNQGNVQLKIELTDSEGEMVSQDIGVGIA